MNILECYAQFILVHIENKLKNLYEHYYSKKILDIINRKSYKKLIDEYEKIYFEKLNEYDNFINEFFEVNKKD